MVSTCSIFRYSPGRRAQRIFACSGMPSQPSRQPKSSRPITGRSPPPMCATAILSRGKRSNSPERIRVLAVDEAPVTARVDQQALEAERAETALAFRDVARIERIEGAEAKI